MIRRFDMSVNDFVSPNISLTIQRLVRGKRVSFFVVCFQVLASFCSLVSRALLIGLDLFNRLATYFEGEAL